MTQSILAWLTYYKHQAYCPPDKARKFGVHLCEDSYHFKEWGYFLRELVNLLAASREEAAMHRVFLGLISDRFQHLFCRRKFGK